MPFGEPSGPPASRRQVETLTELIHAAGHTDFRDARGPLGLNQRQAGGRFTRDEADALIARLESERESDDDDADAVEISAVVVTRRPANRREAEQATALHGIPAELLAAELQRRGWIVVEP
ncbi:MAG: hypothetical protein ACXVJZ_00380 [Acidimicrobiia bacterium]